MSHYLPVLLSQFMYLIRKRLSVVIVSQFRLPVIIQFHSATVLQVGSDGMPELIFSKIMLTHRGNYFFSCYTLKQLIKITKEVKNETCFRIHLILISF